MEESSRRNALRTDADKANFCAGTQRQKFKFRVMALNLHLKGDPKFLCFFFLQIFGGNCAHASRFNAVKGAIYWIGNKTVDHNRRLGKLW